MTSWPSRRAAYGRFTWRLPGPHSGWSRSTPHLMQVGENLSSSPGTVLGKEMQPGCAPAQQLLGQLSSDLDSHPPDLIIVIGDLIDPLCHRLRQRRARELGKPGNLPNIGDRHDARDDRNRAAKRPNPGNQSEVIVGGEEQLSDRETGTGRRLGDQHPRVKIKI